MYPFQIRMRFNVDRFIQTFVHSVKLCGAWVLDRMHAAALWAATTCRGASATLKYDGPTLAAAAGETVAAGARTLSSLLAHLAQHCDDLAIRLARVKASLEEPAMSLGDPEAYGEADTEVNAERVDLA